MQWLDVVTEGKFRPSPRAGLAVATLGVKSFFYGGYSKAAGLHNDCFVLEVPCTLALGGRIDCPSESNKGLKVRFRETLIAGASPVPVFGHKMVPAMSGTKLMIVGGFGAGSDQLNWRRRKSLAGFRNDVSMLDPQVPNVTSILPAHGPTLGGTLSYKIERLDTKYSSSFFLNSIS